MSAAVIHPAQVLANYWDKPLEFVLECFEWREGEGPDEWQRLHLIEIGRQVRSHPFYGRTPVDAIRDATSSGHGAGKTTQAAWIFWWIMCTRRAKGRVTAGTLTQAEITTWAEIQSWHKRLRCGDIFEVTGSYVRHRQHPKDWFAIPLTAAAENAQAFAGQHYREGTSFYIFDEGSIIPDEVWVVADQGLTDGEPMLFAFGNCTRNTGSFYEVCFGDLRHRWTQRTIDSRNCKIPNHREQQKWIEDHGLDSDYVRVRILGLPPQQAEEQLIGKDLVDGARAREVPSMEAEPLVAGVDVPDGGSAWFVVRFRRGRDTRPGPWIPAPYRMPGDRVDRESMTLALARMLGDKDRRRRISAMFIDSQPGAAIVERLRAMNYDNVQEVSFAGKSPDKEYANMRAYMWGKEMRNFLRTGAIDAEDQILRKQLSFPGFHHRVGGDGALVVESKDDMKERFRKAGMPYNSPDDADALALTFAYPVTAYQPDPEPQQGFSGRSKSESWMRRR